MNEGEEIRFIDLFSGIGGFRLGLERSNKVNRESLGEQPSSRKSLRSEGNLSNNEVGKRNSNDISPEQLSAQSRGWNEDTETILNRHSSSTTGERRPHTTKLHYRCVWSNDWDFDEEGRKQGYYANQVYVKQFGEAHHYTGDIRGVDPVKYIWG